MRRIRRKWREFISYVAFRWNRTCYFAGYADGFDQGHFDGWAAVVMEGSEEDEHGAEWSPRERTDFDLGDEEPF